MHKNDDKYIITHILRSFIQGPLINPSEKNNFLVKRCKYSAFGPAS
jgi:hypothetical protein